MGENEWCRIAKKKDKLCCGDFCPRVEPEETGLEVAPENPVVPSSKRIRVGKYNMTSWVEVIVVFSGRMTIGPVVVGFTLINGASGLR